MDNDKRKALRVRRLAHDTKSETFSEMVADLRVLVWDSHLAPPEFSAACGSTVEHAADAFGVYGQAPQEKPSASPSFDDMIQVSAFTLNVDGDLVATKRLTSLKWSRDDSAHTSRTLGARLPASYSHLYASDVLPVRLKSRKVITVRVFIDWISTDPSAFTYHVFACNDLPDTGWTDFDNITFTATTGATSKTVSCDESHGTINTIRPRGVLPMCVNTDDAPPFDHIPRPLSSPHWTASVAQAWIDSEVDNAKFVGPYRIGSSFYKSLGEGSKGGWGIPYHGGGARCWTAGDAIGYRARHLEWIGMVARSPIVASNVDGSPFMPSTPYWLGDSVQMFELGNHHCPPEYAYPIDGDHGSSSAYAQDLYSYHPPEYSHQWRMVRAAAMLAPFNSAARWWLLEVWSECRRWLVGNASGDASNNDLFWSWEHRVQLTPQGHGAKWAGRGLAHVIACLGEAYPYISDGEQLAEDIVGGFDKIQCRDGSVLAALEWDKSTVSNGGTIPDDALRAAAREEQLIVCALDKLAEIGTSHGMGRVLQARIDAMIKSLAESIGAKPGEVYTVNALNDPRFVKVTYQPEYYPGYDHMTLRKWSEYSDGTECLEKAQSRPFQENPLDYTPRGMWEEGL